MVSHSEHVVDILEPAQMAQYMMAPGTMTPSGDRAKIPLLMGEHMKAIGTVAREIGQGRKTWPGDAVYEGSWRNDMRHGQGILRVMGQSMREDRQMTSMHKLPCACG